MINIIKKIYNKIAMIPITLLIFAGVYEMFIGDLIRGVINGDVSWIIPVTQSMLIDTFITLIIVYFLINGFPKRFKRLWENTSTKWIGNTIVMIFAIFAILFFVVGQMFMGKVLFYINYLIFVGVLALLCVLQKVIDGRFF